MKKHMLEILYLLVSFMTCNLLFNSINEDGYNQILSNLLMIIPFLFGEIYHVFINDLYN